VELDLPADPPIEIDEPDGLRTALRCADILGVGRGRYDLLVQVGSAGQVRALAPDIGALGRLPFRGVVVTAPDDTGSGVVTRCFYPAVGVPEDPASGSAHCTVGGWWFDRMGVDRLVARQLSRRTGTIVVSRNGDRVELSGGAVTVMWGQLPLPDPTARNGEFT
jgi:predicted PhzF superfamily epimerase YddE/YHI9